MSGSFQLLQYYYFPEAVTPPDPQPGPSVGVLQPYEIVCNACGTSWPLHVEFQTGISEFTGQQGIIFTSLPAFGLAFKVVGTFRPRSCGFTLNRINNPTGDVIYRIYNTLGDFDTGNVTPTGAAILEFNQFPASDIVENPDFSLYRASASADLILTSGVYFLSVELLSGDGSNYITAKTNNDASLYAGNMARNLNPGGWTVGGSIPNVTIGGLAEEPGSGMYYFEGTRWDGAQANIGDYEIIDNIETLTFCPGCHTRGLKHGDVSKTGTFHRDPFYEHDDRYYKADVDKGVNVYEGNPDVINKPY